MDRDKGKENDIVVSFFNLEYLSNVIEPQFIYGMLHYGTPAESDAAFLELLRQINDNLDIADISTPHYCLEKYDFEDGDHLPEPKSKDKSDYPGQIRNWKRNVGFVPARRINVWQAAITFALNPEISNYAEFINTYRNVVEAIRTGRGIMGHAATQEKLDKDRAILKTIPNLITETSASEKMQEKPKVQNPIKKTVKKTRGI